MAFNAKYATFIRGKKQEHGFKINNDIRALQIRIVGDNIESKICTIKEALEIAANFGLDLVEINSEASPPVCKIIDFQKFLYEKKKKEREVKNANKSTTKEIKLGPRINDHDLNTKISHSIEFLTKGHKVKAYIMFKGREIVYKEQGEVIILKYMQALAEYGKPESMPRLEGKNMHVTIAPKKH